MVATWRMVNAARRYYHQWDNSADGRVHIAVAAVMRSLEIVE